MGVTPGPVWTLRSYTPLPAAVPLDECAINPWLTQLTLTQARPGGFTGITVGLSEMPVASSAGQRRGFPFLPRPVYVQTLGHIEVWCGAQIVSEGRLVETDTGGTACTGLRAEGYATQALTDGAWYPLPSAEDTTQYTAGRLLRQCLADTAPLVRPPNAADFYDTGVLHGYAALQGKNAWQLAQQFGTEGDGSSLYDLMLFEGRRTYFLPRVAPTAPTYLDDWDAGVSDASTTADLVGTVYVRYTDAVSGATNQLAGPYSNPTFAARYGGLMRSREVNGGVQDANGAAAYAQTYLAKYSSPTYRIQVRRDGWRGFRLPPGGYRAPWFARCNEWMQVGADGAILPIVRIDCNVTNGQTTVQLGDPPVDFNGLTAELARVTRLVTRNQNPNSYATA